MYAGNSGVVPCFETGRETAFRDINCLQFHAGTCFAVIVPQLNVQCYGRRAYEFFSERGAFVTFTRPCSNPHLTRFIKVREHRECPNLDTDLIRRNQFHTLPTNLRVR